MNESTSSVILSPDATAVVRQTPGRAVVQVVGEVDERAASAARSLVDLAVRSADVVLVDLSDVTFFSAAGVSWLAHLYQRGAGEVRVVAASEPVREVLQTCGVPLRSRGGLPSPRHADAH